jgi:Zn-dependent protease
VRPFLLPVLPDTASVTAFALIEVVGELSVWFALINILPLPPLTGAHLLVAVAPACERLIGRIAPYAGLMLALVAATGMFAKTLGPGYRILSRWIMGG